jgi:hypothetical protein
MAGKLTLFTIDQPDVSIFRKSKSSKHDWPGPVITLVDPRGTAGADWPRPVITALPSARDARPHFVFKTLGDAMATLRATLPDPASLKRSSAMGAPHLVLHVEHDPELDLAELHFIKPLLAKGLDVAVGLLPEKTQEP